jgi:hypothetical protein
MVKVEPLEVFGVNVQAVAVPALEKSPDAKPVID